jgi:chromosomal replication initiation ATPase DnaA
MDATAESTAAPDLDEPNSPYTRWAAVFSKVHNETHSIEVALEVLDTLRERERVVRPRQHDESRRILEIAASLFHVPIKRLHERNRRSDVVSARYVAAWLLRRRHWSYPKIAEFFGLDHSTIISGLRKVARTNHLLLAASKAEHLLAFETDREAQQHAA